MLKEHLSNWRMIRVLHGSNVCFRTGEKRWRAEKEKESAEKEKGLKGRDRFRPTRVAL